MTDPFLLFNSISEAQPAALVGLGFLATVLKWAVVLVLAIYTVMAGLLYRQMTTMSDQLEDQANGPIRTIALVHLLASLLLTVAVILVG